MSLIDVTQYKRKLKHPQIRRWVHPKSGKDDYYYAVKATKKKLLLATKIKSKSTREGLVEAPLVGYKGREYGVKEFLKKFPKFKLKKKKKRRR